MKATKYLSLAALAAVLPFVASQRSQAQVSVGINLGPAPVCPYGYYDYPPYNCAPYGFYGPEWFNGGVFLGAGPWFHGPRGFHGHVDSHFDPRYGYHGGYPNRGQAWHEPPDHFQNFHGGDVHDGHAYVSRGGGHPEGGGHPR